MPLTRKGKKIKAAMTEQYGEKEGERVFYASKNAGTISGVDAWSEQAREAAAATRKRKGRIEQSVREGVASYRRGHEKAAAREYPEGRKSYKQRIGNINKIMQGYERHGLGGAAKHMAVAYGPIDSGGAMQQTQFEFPTDARRKKGIVRDPMGREKETYEEETGDGVQILGDATYSQHLSMCDAVELDDKAGVTYTRDGVLKAMPRIARTGIQIYGGDEVGHPDKEWVRVFRPADTVFANDAVHTYTHLPVTLDHPSELVTTHNWKKYAVGDTGDEVLREGGTVRVPMMLRDAAAIKAFKDGQNQLSVGYECDLVWTPGLTEDGEEYDALQSNIKANHLAVVTNARGGDQLKIGDDGQRGDSAMNLKNVTVDGIECQMTDTAAALVQKTIKALNDRYTGLVDEFDKFKKKKDDDDDECEDAMKKAEDALKTKDAEIATLKQQVVDAKVTPAMLHQMVRDWHEVTSKARALLGDKVKIDDNNIDVEDIRKQVVSAKMGDRAKDWGPKEIKASFDSLTSDIKASDQSKPTGNQFADAVRAFAQPMHPVNIGDAEAIKQKAYDEMVKDGEAAWKRLGQAAQ